MVNGQPTEKNLRPEGGGNVPEVVWHRHKKIEEEEVEEGPA